jgi:transposase
VSIQVCEEIPDPPKATGEPIGVDLGISAMATCSDGVVIEDPKALRSKLKRLKRLQRRLSRVAGMLKNHHLAQAIADVGLAEFRRQVEYKSRWQGETLHLASCWYPSPLSHLSHPVRKGCSSQRCKCS